MTQQHDGHHHHRPEMHLKHLLLSPLRNNGLHFQIFSTMTTKNFSRLARGISLCKGVCLGASTSPQDQPAAMSAARPLHVPMSTRGPSLLQTAGSAVEQRCRAHSNCWGRLQKTFSFTLSAKVAQILTTRRAIIGRMGDSHGSGPRPDK